MKIIKFIVFLCIFGIINLVTADNKTADENIINAYYFRLKSTIKSDKPLVLEKFVTRNDRIAARMSVKICNLFEKTTIISEKCRALYTLGVIKHPASIRTLVKNIDFYKPMSSSTIITEPPLIATRPAKQALIAIGPRCIPYVIKEFLTTKNVMKRYFCLETIYRTLIGFSRNEARDTVRLIVKNRIKKSSSPNKELLLEELDNFKPGKHL